MIKGMLSIFCKGKPIHIVSYPKSGNTWIRFLIANYLYGAELKLSNINYYIPDHEVSSQKDYSIRCPRFIKRHTIPEVIENPTIYIYRDARDVAVSYYYYLMRKGLIEGMSFSQFLETRFLIGQIPYGSWKDHVTRWLSIRKKRYLNLKYEDVLVDPYSALEKILHFSNIQIHPNRISVSVERSTIDRLKENEKSDQSIFQEKYHVKNPAYVFFRKGINGDWKNHFSRADLDLFDYSFKDTMRELNY